MVEEAVFGSLLIYSSLDVRSNSSGHYTPTMASTDQSPSSVTSDLTEDDLELESAPTRQCFRRPFFDCVFYFLSCDYRSEDESEWYSHCTSHFQGHDFPNELECFLCSDFSARSQGDTTAWNQILDHIVTQHGSGHNVTRTTPPQSIVCFLDKQNANRENSKGQVAPQSELTKAQRQVGCAEKGLRSLFEEGSTERIECQTGSPPDTLLTHGLIHELAQSDFILTAMVSRPREDFADRETPLSNEGEPLTHDSANRSKPAGIIAETMYNPPKILYKTALLMKACHFPASILHLTMKRLQILNTWSQAILPDPHPPASLSATAKRSTQTKKTMTTRLVKKTELRKL
jgi:hypothetical protein